MWNRRSWLKCRPVGKGNENDIAPEAEKGSRAFRVVLGDLLPYKNSRIYEEMAGRTCGRTNSCIANRRTHGSWWN